jgi:hypothetical protein
LGAARAYPAVILAFEHDDFGAMQGFAHKVVASLQGKSGAHQTFVVNFLLYNFSDFEARAEYLLGDFAAAEQSERTAAQAYKDSQNNAPRDEAQINTWLTMALAREGKQAEAAAIIGPVIALYRKLDHENRGDQWLGLEVAGALYAQALAEPQHRTALLTEAAQHIDRLAPNIAALHDSREWRERIGAALHAAAGGVDK